jgi:hypothetical protein
VKQDALAARNVGCDLPEKLRERCILFVCGVKELNG